MNFYLLIEKDTKSKCPHRCYQLAYIWLRDNLLPRLCTTVISERIYLIGPCCQLARVGTSMMDVSGRSEIE